MSQFKDLILSANVVFWDFDGVIKKSNLVKNNAFYNLFEDISEVQRNYVLNHHIEHQGLSRFIKIPHYLQYLNMESNKENIDNYLRKFSELVLNGVIESSYVEGDLDILPKVKNSVIVTATPENEIKIILEKLKISKFFSKVYGSPKTKIECLEDYSNQYGIVPNRCLFIGDSKSDFDCARHHKIEIVFVRNEYNRHLNLDEKVIQIDNFL